LVYDIFFNLVYDGNPFWIMLQARAYKYLDAIAIFEDPFIFGIVIDRG
jgi:hypothetical protein